MIEQYLDINDENRYVLTNKITLDPILKDNYENRMAVGKGLGSSFRPIGSIPVPVLERDIDGIAFINATPGSPEERAALRRFLAKNPEYRTSEGRF